MPRKARVDMAGFYQNDPTEPEEELI